jgi:predicted GIY-YIG superfamily endonuclease
MEHRDGTTQSTAGKNPKLVWFSTLSSRDEATELEVKLKRLCDQNPREIRRWIRRFQDLVEELEFN